MPCISMHTWNPQVNYKENNKQESNQIVHLKSIVGSIFFEKKVEFHMHPESHTQRHIAIATQ